MKHLFPILAASLSLVFCGVLSVVGHAQDSAKSTRYVLTFRIPDEVTQAITVQDNEPFQVITNTGQTQYSISGTAHFFEGQATVETEVKRTKITELVPGQKTVKNQSVHTTIKLSPDGQEKEITSFGNPSVTLSLTPSSDADVP